MSLLVLPCGPVRGDEIPDAGSSVPDGGGQDRSHRIVEPPDGPGPQTIGRPMGMQTSPVQDLVRIDVPDAGDPLLMHQQRFDTTPPPFHQLPEVLPSDRQGIASESAVKLIVPPLFSA